MARRDVEFNYIRTDYMLADMFTKAVPGSKLLTYCGGIGVESEGLTSLRGSVEDMRSYLTSSPRHEQLPYQLPAKA